MATLLIRAARMAPRILASVTETPHIQMAATDQAAHPNPMVVRLIRIGTTVPAALLSTTVIPVTQTIAMALPAQHNAMVIPPMSMAVTVRARRVRETVVQHIAIVHIEDSRMPGANISNLRCGT
jgi:hypothetical protein